jgi:hypothetical protein
LRWQFDGGTNQKEKKLSLIYKEPVRFEEFRPLQDHLIDATPRLVLENLVELQFLIPKGDVVGHGLDIVSISRHENVLVIGVVVVFLVRLQKGDLFLRGKMQFVNNVEHLLVPHPFY